MTHDEARELATTDAASAIAIARGSGTDAVTFITGNNFMPPLRAFGSAETVWQADVDGFYWETYSDTFEAECERGNVYVGCPDYDNALYVVDLARWQTRDFVVAMPDEDLADEWAPVQADAEVSS